MGPRERPISDAALPRRNSASPEIARDSCNFSGSAGVVKSNDASPVQTIEAGLKPAADFTTFMRNYQDMVFSTAVRLTGNHAQAEDIAQEVFLRAHKNFDHLATSATAGGWLKTVATNLSLNHLSRYRNRWRFFSELRRGEDDDAPELEFAAPDSFFRNLEAAERRAFVEDALRQLPAHQRVPLVLYHFDDMPYDEIAKRLGVSLAKVKTDILRGRAALAKLLVRADSAYEE
jgi:RNA polymerase sigma-70 factor, ECF subfamily